jgi:tetraacyldisaccharide 4'-kinase
MEIVLYDARAGFGNGRCLPAGPLREPLSRLNSVDFVLARGLDDSASGVRLRIDALVNVRTGEQRPAAPVSVGETVYAVAGVGQPDLFFDALGACGFSVEKQSYPDHYTYSAEDFVALADRPIIMTEKDAVKCHGLAGDNAWYLKVSAILPGAVIESVLALVHR